MDILFCELQEKPKLQYHSIIRNFHFNFHFYTREQVWQYNKTIINPVMCLHGPHFLVCGTDLSRVVLSVQ